MGDVYSCRLFPSGMVVLSGGADRQLKIWSVLDGSCPRTLVGHSRGTGHTYFTTTTNYFEKRRFSKLHIFFLQGSLTLLSSIVVETSYVSLL